MGIIQSKSTDGYTPICNKCGVHLCWDISYVEYEEDEEFWDTWECEDCNPFAKGAHKRFRKEKKTMRLSDVLNLAEKTYTPKGNGVQGKILSVGAVKQDGEWYNQPVMLVGLDNTQSLIDHSSKYPDGMLNQSHVGKDSTWRLKWWMNNKLQKQMLTGYPEIKIPGEPSQTAQAPPVAPQNAPQPAQATNSTPDWDAIAEGKVRHGVVCAFIVAGHAEVDISAVDYWVRYIIDGTVNAPEPESSGQVCTSCQQLHQDCTCERPF